MKQWKGLNIKVINMKSLAEMVVGNSRSIGCGGGCTAGCTPCEFLYWF